MSIGFEKREKLMRRFFGREMTKDAIVRTAIKISFVRGFI